MKLLGILALFTGLALSTCALAEDCWPESGGKVIATCTIEGRTDGAKACLYKFENAGEVVKTSDHSGAYTSGPYYGTEFGEVWAYAVSIPQEGKVSGAVYFWLKSWLIQNNAGFLVAEEPSGRGNDLFLDRSTGRATVREVTFKVQKQLNCSFN